MGVDISVHIERHNKTTCKYEDVSLYKKDEQGKYERVSVYDGRNSYLFGLLAGVGGVYIYPERLGFLVSPRGIPDNLSDYAKEEYGDGECFFNETWYDLCELEAYAYSLSQAKDTISSLIDKINELDDENKYDTNDIVEDLSAIDLLSNFVDCIKDVLNAYDIYEYKPGDYRVVMWFDC